MKYKGSEKMKKIFKTIFDFIFEIYILFVFIMASIFAIACFYVIPKVGFEVLITSIIILALNGIINKFFNKEK